ATELALTGGEDYELLFTSPLAGDELAQHLSRLGITVPCTAIGQLTATPGMHITTLDGRTILPESFATYRHF
ncbi:MAG: thiamine-phosphate kinase, partial [Candidatus Sumerlaeia bacterium]|nr:thiamine-phosphate kinase [Candidatus Sumerlaeia bacterium]